MKYLENSVTSTQQRRVSLHAVRSGHCFSGPCCQSAASPKSLSSPRQSPAPPSSITAAIDTIRDLVSLQVDKKKTTQAGINQHT